MNWTLEEKIVLGFLHYYLMKILVQPKVKERQEVLLYAKELNDQPIQLVEDSFKQNVERILGVASSINYKFKEIFGQVLSPRQENVQRFSQMVEQMLKSCLEQEPNWEDIERALNEIEQWGL